MVNIKERVIIGIWILGLTLSYSYVWSVNNNKLHQHYGINTSFCNWKKCWRAALPPLFFLLKKRIAPSNSCEDVQSHQFNIIRMLKAYLWLHISFQISYCDACNIAQYNHLRLKIRHFKLGVNTGYGKFLSFHH